MKTTFLGKSGFKISVIGIGLWQIGSRFWNFRNNSIEKTCLEIVENAYKGGINFYDTAEIYGNGLSEKYLGLAIRKLGIRDNVVIASKVAGYKYTEESIVKAVKKTCERMGFKPDLIQHHWLPPFYSNICRVINIYEKLVDQGYVSLYGLSNFNEKYLVKAIECSKKYEPVSNQVQYNLGYRVVENNLINIMEKYRLTLIAWSPLAKGALSGLSNPNTTAQKRDSVFKEVIRDRDLQNLLNNLANKYGVSKSTIALAWLVHKKAVPIPGTRNPARIIDYVKAGEIELSASDLEALDSVSNKYVTKWGSSYSSLSIMRYIPGFIQNLVFKLIDGI
ncbi:MAG: aldo/keto reductase [Desulfurococcaceae archaeon]